MLAVPALALRVRIVRFPCTLGPLESPLAKGAVEHVVLARRKEMWTLEVLGAIGKLICPQEGWL